MTTPEEARGILGLRLLIARAANKDSLAWWDDESLTAPAGFLLERLFPVAPPLAARSLTLSAAAARHSAALGERDSALHLYRLDLDNQDALAVQSVSLLTVAFPLGPIPSVEALRQCLLDALGPPARYTVIQRSDAGGLQIAIPRAPAGVSTVWHRAQALAWAYLEGARNAPVFPFCVE